MVCSSITRPTMPAISVIIPTLNEESAISALLASLAALGAGEIIVADGGSIDRTRELAAPHATVLRCPAGRAGQMNAGARAASGDILLFLHADARLEAGALESIRRAMADASVPGGAFDIRYDGGDLPARAFTWINRVRRDCGIFYGDAGIFCRRDIFIAMGGFREWPIMEDYEFARRLWKTGPLALLDDAILVSDRRWRKAGLLRTLWSWFLIQSLYYARVSPARLARLYPHIR
jgi:rSAM/selenodomain-associated transferase 2